jgi:Methylamine utilisation protein MauE
MVWLALDIVARLTAGGIFFTAGAAKLSSPATWRQLWLAAYQLLPRPLVRPAARLLPAAEITVGTALLSGAFGAVGLAAAAGLLMVLTLAVIMALLRHLEISCGCTGRLAGRVSWRVVERNLALVAVLLLPAWHGGYTAVASVVGLPWAVQLAGLALVPAAVHGVYAAARWRQRGAFLAGLGHPVA